MNADSKSDFTRTGVRRAGDDYQDTVALDLFVEWLEHPERYTAMRVEADDSGFLDDVVAESQGELLAVQVKFSAHPNAEDDPWSLEALLAEREGKRTNGSARTLPSLLAKWSSSIRTLRLADASRSIRARVVSNRKPTPQFLALLTPGGNLQIERISDQAIRDELVRQLGTEATADILASLTFDLDHPGLDTLEDAVRRRFFRLGFDERGWLNLKDELRGWVRHRNEPPPNGRITLEAVRRAAGWHDLRGLPQDFPIPDDYVLPSEEFHRSVQEALASGSSCLVLTAAPGFGKSTYASYLYEELRRASSPVVRHHYYLFQAERALNRLEHRVAAESLMHDLLSDHADALGDTATHQPDPSRLREFLEACGRHYGAQNSRLIVMLDGLDHVWKERRTVEQLTELLDQILPIPAGVVLLVATQPVADEQLPRALLTAAPRSHWIWLPKLGPSAVETWVRHHRDALTDPDGNEPNDHTIERISTAFFDISQGHPLHLRYSFRALRERGIRIDDLSIRNLPPCPTDEISDYYATLLLNLPEGARLVLDLFASSQFSWPRSGLLDCLQRLGVNRADGNKAVTDVMHLLTRDALGLRTFHPSILAFVAQQTDYPDNVPVLLTITLEWLQSDAPDHWRWSYEWILQAATGNGAQLMEGPDRQWAVEAVAMRRSAEAIEQILSQSGSLACTPQNLPISLERGVTLSYWSDIAQSHQSVAESGLFAQLIAQEDPLIRARLSASLDDLTDREAYLLAESAFAAGDVSLVARCFEALKTRLNSRRLRSSEHEPWAVRVAPVLAAAALADNVSSAVTFSLGDHDNAAVFVNHLVSELVRARQVERLRALWQEVLAVLSDNKRGVPPGLGAAIVATVAGGLVRLGLEEGIDVDEVFHDFTAEDPLVAIYAVIRQKATCPTQVPLPAMQLPSARWFDATQTAALSRRFQDVFRRLVANHLLGRSDTNSAWLGNLSGEAWAIEWLHRLDRAARGSADHLVRAAPLTLSALYGHFSDLPFPRWQAGRDESPRQYAVVARSALFQIGLELLQIESATDGNNRVSEDDIREAARSSYFEMRAWVHDYLESRRRWLSSEALDYVFSHQRLELDTTIEHFSERASVYTQLASLAAVQGRIDVAKDLLRDAARNLLSHGYHKDMLLFHALGVVRLHHNMPEGATELLQRPEAERSWLLQLAAPIAHVTEFTDGDETHGLPDELADALSDVAPDLLVHYYLGLIAAEEYSDATHAFRRLVEILPSDNPLAAAVLGTAVDDIAREALAKRAGSGAENATTISRQLDAYFGARSSRLRDTADDTQPTTDTEDTSVVPSTHPPDRLVGYLEALKAARQYDTNRHLERWLTYWTTNGRGLEAFDSARRAVDAGLFYQPAEAMWRTARLLYGKNVGFDWLARAQRETGWNKWFSRQEDSEARWKVVKTEYPDRWFEFLRRSFEADSGRSSHGVQIGHFAWVRVVDYLITVGQFELASRCVAMMTKLTIELVSAVTLPPPDWLSNLTELNHGA